MREPPAWHGTHEVPENKMIAIAIGPLWLVIAHRPGEWRVGWRSDRDPELESRVAVGEPEELAESGADLTVQRFLSGSVGDQVRLRPLLADRPVVARPENPLMVPAGDEATVFVATPLWVRIELPDPDRTLLELPTLRPSDTWFGSNTLSGTVAYASPTTARVTLDNLPHLAGRAISKIIIQNQAETVLALERISLPAPSLQLFVDRSGLCWTASLQAVRHSDSAKARVEVEPAAPAEAVGAKLIAEPRQNSEKSVFSRALNVLVG